MTDKEQKVWKLVHNWCEQQAHSIPDQNRRVLMDLIMQLFQTYKTTLETSKDRLFDCNVTSCCKVGPIVNEQFCPRCGKEIYKS